MRKVIKVTFTTVCLWLKTKWKERGFVGLNVAKLAPTAAGMLEGEINLSVS